MFELDLTLSMKVHLWWSNNLDGQIYGNHVFTIMICIIKSILTFPFTTTYLLRQLEFWKSLDLTLRMKIHLYNLDTTNLCKSCFHNYVTDDMYEFFWHEGKVLFIILAAFSSTSSLTLDEIWWSTVWASVQALIKRYFYALVWL